jgi:hypothetical protein
LVEADVVPEGQYWYVLEACYDFFGPAATPSGSDLFIVPPGLVSSLRGVRSTLDAAATEGGSIPHGLIRIASSLGGGGNGADNFRSFYPPNNLKRIIVPPKSYLRASEVGSGGAGTNLELTLMVLRMRIEEPIPTF